MTRSRITGLGHCARSLGDIADVTGDGKLDVIVRRCPGGALPDLPGVIAGRADWPAEIQVQGAVVETALMPDPRGPGAETGIDPIPEGLAAHLDGDGDLELVLARHVAPPAGESDSSSAPPPGPLYIFDGDWQERAVLDLLRDSPPPAATWRKLPLALAGIADIDGDGRSDLLVASDPRSEATLVGVFLGPVLR
jgi:hypothetical protein